MQISQTTCHIISLRSKYSPQHPVLKHPHLCSSLKVRPSFSPIRKNYFLIFTFLDSKWEDKRFQIEWQQAICKFNFLLISSWIKAWLVTVIHKYLNRATFSKDLLAIFIVWFYPIFWWWHSNICLVLSAFTSRPTSLVASSLSFCVLLYCIYNCS
jgi:hypothetical protein